MNKYQHGGDVVGFAASLGCSVDEIIDLSSNINHIKPKINIDFNSLDISPYPSYEQLYQNIANHYDISPSNLSIYNGASSSIFALFAKLDLDKCFVYTPAYLEYKRVCDIHDIKYIPIDRFHNIDKEITKNSIVVFVNPSTPDGKHYNLEHLMQTWQEKNATIIIDESFLEFCTQPSSIDKINSYDKLYIIKSMTKFYGSAGIRIGCIISNQHNIKALKNIAPAWQLSSFDIAYIQDALLDKDLKHKTLQSLKQNRAKLIEILQNSSYVEHIYPSDANFLLVRLNITANKFQEILKAHKILIRDCSNFDGLDSYHIRIAIKDMDYIDRLQKTLTHPSK